MIAKGFSRPRLKRLRDHGRCADSYWISMIMEDLPTPCGTKSFAIVGAGLPEPGVPWRGGLGYRP